MAAVIDRPNLLQRIKPVFQGFDVLLVLAIVLLAAIGLTTMYSVGFDHGTRFANHARNMLLAAGVLFIVSQVPPQRLMMLAVPIYVVGVVLLLGVEFFGIAKKGAQRWLNVGVVIQPSEIMKIAMPLMLAWWFQRREGQLTATDFLVAGLILAIPAALILKQPDLGTTLLVVASGLFVIFFAGLSWKLIIPPVVLGWWVSPCSSSWSPSGARPGWTGRCCTSTSASASARCWTRSRTRWARASTSSRA